MRDKYPEELIRFSVRGKHAKGYREGTNIVLIDPDLHGLFPDSKAVNLALLGCVSAKANRNLALSDQRGKAARLKREV